MKKRLLSLLFIISLFSMLAACNDKDDENPVMSSDPVVSVSPSMSPSMEPSMAPSMSPEATVAP